MPGHLSDRELFESLDLSLPALSGVRASMPAAADGDYAGAKAALGKYLRERSIPTWKFDPRAVDRTATWSAAGAAAAASGQVKVVTIPYDFPNGDINWKLNITRERADLPDNNEWQWQLNRMGWWDELGRAYWGSGDEKWARAWAAQLRSWAAQSPAPAKAENGAGSMWRTIESGIRMSGAWPEAWHHFLLSPSVSDDDRALYLKLCIEHARYLSKFPSRGNWLTMEMAGLYTVGVVFPELKDARAWRKRAGDTLHRELKAQFLPDCAQVELSPGYHQVALSNILHIPTLARQTGHSDELPADFVARMESIYDFNLLLMTPDRNWPRFNDSWPVGVPGVMEPAAELFPARPDFAWAASKGARGAEPKETSHPFPYAGYFVMRSSWAEDANYLVLDAGPLGYGHVHQDKLNVVMWCYGREILFDGGGGSYESSRYRSFATDTFGHNTILVDGQPQRRQTRDREANISKAPVEAGWASTPRFDYARGVYSDGYGKEDARLATHTRRVLFVKPDLVLIGDTLQPVDNAEHVYQARWHLLPTQTQLDQASKIVVTNEVGKSNLAIIPLAVEGLEVKVASAQLEPELLGWNVRKDMDPQYVPATTVLHTRRAAGAQRFLTLLAPMRAGQPSPIQSASVAPGAGGSIVSVKWRDGRSTLIEVPDDAEKPLALLPLAPR